jgi:hypothetical protein
MKWPNFPPLERLLDLSMEALNRGEKGDENSENFLRLNRDCTILELTKIF